MLRNKAVVVTGSGRGIGAACAKGIVRQGAAVVINDVNAAVAEKTATEIRSAGGKAIAVVADVSKWDEAARLIQACVLEFGQIDGLVNNAALCFPTPLVQLDPAVARGMIEVNVLGPMYCMAHAVKAMLPRKSGSIVNVCSGAHLGMPPLGVYGASKGAVASMVYGWAMELSGSGIRVNGVSPMGATDIGANSRDFLVEHYGAQIQPGDSSRAASVLLQPPEANSPVIEYLLSDSAADVNGQIFRINKGEMQLYTHPTLLLPALPCENWTAQGIAAVMAGQPKQRQVPCGAAWGTEHLPVQLVASGGAWKVAQSVASS
jgi:NAD(P)-dependent dehydrogenase (short-subunit alcohol dehydrogenase family)